MRSIATLAVLMTAAAASSQGQPPLPVEVTNQPETRVVPNEAGRLDALAGFRDFTWGMSKKDALRLAKGHGGELRQEPERILVVVSKLPNGTHKEWFRLDFDGGRLASVDHRHNTPGPPRASEIISELRGQYGPPTSKGGAGTYGSNFENEWDGRLTTIKARNQKSEQFVIIEYRAQPRALEHAKPDIREHGRWRYSDGLASSVITIYTSGGKLLLKEQFDDGSRRVFEVTEATGKRKVYRNKSEQAEHFAVDTRGNLVLHDADGAFGTATRVPQP